MSLPILDSEALKRNLADLGEEILALLKQTAENFVADNKDDALVLGTANVKAILDAQFYSMIEIPELPELALANCPVRHCHIWILPDRRFRHVPAGQIHAECLGRAAAAPKEIRRTQ